MMKDSDDDGYDGRKLVVPYKEPLKDEVYTRPMFALRAIEGYAPQPVVRWRRSYLRFCVCLCACVCVCVCVCE